MPPDRLTPQSTLLGEEYVLVQAWKKTHKYIRRYNWYADVLELDLTNANLENCIGAIRDEINSSNHLVSQPLRLVLAPKSQQWGIKNNKWKPVGTAASVDNRLRPLAHATARDQIIATSFMLLIADIVETRQGDPRVTPVDAHQRKIVSYGHRLFCDSDQRSMHFRWGSDVTYRQYFQDYKTFVSRPQAVVDYKFGHESDWAIIYVDLSQFYDRIRPSRLHSKIAALASSAADLLFLRKFKTFFNWRWSNADEDDALEYASNSDPLIEGFDEVALPQGLVASGFFSNAFLIDFDEAVSNRFDQWECDNQWQLIDYCRYVDDMRIVIGLGSALRNATDQVIKSSVFNYLESKLTDHAPGLRISPSKCSIVLGRDSAAGSIRVSSTMKRIEANTSGPIDFSGKEETIDLIEGLIFTQQEEPLNFEDRFRDSFFAAKPDVRDDTVARFAANRFRRTYRSLRPICDRETVQSQRILLPMLSQDDLDHKAAHFCRRLIERWVRDPSNIRLMLVALDVNPDENSLDVVLQLIEQHLNNRRGRKGPRRVAWYCAAELLKAGATATGMVVDPDSLPAHVDLAGYQTRLGDLANQIVAHPNRYPWYLEQQAHLYIACAGESGDHVGLPAPDHHLYNYIVLHSVLNGRSNRDTPPNILPYIFIQAQLRQPSVAASTAIAYFRSLPSSEQRSALIQILKEDSELAVIVRSLMTPDEKRTWEYLYSIYGMISRGHFPDSPNALPTNETSYSLVSVCRSLCNPFQQEYAALRFALAFLEQVDSDRGLVFPWRIRIKARNWRALWSDRFPIPEDSIRLELNDSPETDARFSIPNWIEETHAWKYQLGQILRVLLTGLSDYTLAAELPRRKRSGVLYRPYRSSWLRRRYGLYNGRNAFGQPWLPVSTWLASLLARLLAWPGTLRNQGELALPEEFGRNELAAAIGNRISELETLYGRASYTAVLPVRVFRHPRRWRFSSVPLANLSTLRVGVVQTVMPKASDFKGDPELNNAAYRQRHRRHVAAVLGGVHRMLQIRETHCNHGSWIELLVLPELSVHPDDVRDLLVPFAKRHKCIIFAGIAFHYLHAFTHGMVNTAYWIIPVQTAHGGVQIETLQQGKWNLTQGEIALNIQQFRPVQWILDLIDPSDEDRLWSMTGAICYDSTDLALAADLRNLTQMFVVPALNQDVGTFDNMAAALHYHMYQHMVVANSGEYGGSTVQAPFNKRHERTIFHSHGGDQVSISFFDVDLSCYTGASAKLKTPPAGYKRLR